MDLPILIKHRLRELGLEQKDLALAAQVTESYISQLLAGKKPPPAPGRTGIYDKVGGFLKLPSGQLSKLADVQREEDLKKKVGKPARPLYKECRELILRKCDPLREDEVRRIFEKEPFGEVERLITQLLLNLAQRAAGEEPESDEEAARVAILDSTVISWDIDLKAFSIDVVVSSTPEPDSHRRFEFVETEPQQPIGIESGLARFLGDESLSGDVTEEEIEFLRRLSFKNRRPSPIYYYRELQNLRDPLHFPDPA